MCGITGFFAPHGRSRAAEMSEVVERMAGALAHRGPDDSGSFVDPDAGVALGFRRLSIIDLSPAGHQPMFSATGRYAIAYNGEVYNFERIRAELVAAGAAPQFSGHSDTEVMLAAIEAWGLEAAVQRFIGMFAIAVWDREERKLHLVRDRIGVKPLYFGRAGDAIVFGSELKALRQHPGFSGEIDRDALALYVRFAYVPTPYAIYRGIEKLTPGTIATFAEGHAEPVRTVYWSLREVAEKGLRDPLRGSPSELTASLDTLLRDSVALRMISDVPLGVFLSGGIDSSTVVALMQAQSTRKVRTFSIGFREEGWDEAQYAAAVARHLGTDHTELYVTAEEAMAVIPKIPSIYDEPFADSSQIPTYLVSQMARREVTVSLSGDGGDELFGGYHRYFLGRSVWRNINRVPRMLRRPAGRALSMPSPAAWDRILRVSRPILPGTLRQVHAGAKIHKAARLLESGGADAMYRQLVSFWEGSIVRGANAGHTIVDDPAAWPSISDPTLRMMVLDTLTYLPDDILVKVDRASMAVSLEAREPLLDHRLVEYAWRLPMEQKVVEGRGKVLLRAVLRQYVPDSLIDRPKMGFGFPVGEWLRGPLRDWAEDLLDPARMREAGYLDVQAVRGRWEDHLRGRGSWDHHLWIVLMFESWLREQRNATVAPAPAPQHAAY